MLPLAVLLGVGATGPQLGARRRCSRRVFDLPFQNLRLRFTQDCPVICVRVSVREALHGNLIKLDKSTGSPYGRREGLVPAWKAGETDYLNLQLVEGSGSIS